MVEPILDEERIHRILTDPNAMLSPNGVRSLMSLVLMACYDRKVERTFFAEMIDCTVEVGIIIANLESAAKLRSAMAMLKPNASPKLMDEKIDALARAWARKRRAVGDKFELMMQCPTGLDMVS